MARMLDVFEPGDSFLTTDAHGGVREWRVRKDGLAKIVASALFRTETEESTLTNPPPKPPTGDPWTPTEN